MFAYRGFMIDSARHYQSIDDIKEIIDAMAYLNFNKFHWHLTDDQGWRFESRVYPELNKAAVRPFSNFGKTFSNEPYGIVYTKEEMQDIVDFCAERNIEVIPEFDMPGHMSALLSVFPRLACCGKDVKIKTRQGIYKDVLCPASDEVYEVIKNILDEICEVFPGELIHLGGDEVPPNQWEGCEKCRALMKELKCENFAEYQNVFLNRIIDYLESKGRHCIVWNDTAKGKNLDKRAILQYWKENDKDSVDYINSGGKAIMSPFSYYYTDYGYDITPLNRVYSFNPYIKGLTEDGKKNIIGVETPVWTEYIETKEHMQRFMFPRVIAVSYTAQGKNDIEFKQFLKETKEIQKVLEGKGIVFEKEKNWRHLRITSVKGWLKFVHTHYTREYIKSTKE